MAIFAYASGCVDQIGGNFILPEVVTHLPRFQGSSFTLPPGLEISGDRAFIWSLNKEYQGVVGIRDVETATPTVDFDPESFSAPFVEIRCTIKGQPLNYVVYNIFTSISSPFYAGATTYSSLEFDDYNIKDESFTINNSLIQEANYTADIISNLILYWKPPAFGNVDYYKVEKWGSGWEFIGITSNPSYIIPKQAITYRITPVYFKYAPGIEQPRTVSVILEGIVAKSFWTPYQSTFTYINTPITPSTDIFFTVFKTREYESDLDLYQDKFTYMSDIDQTITYTDTFWIQVFSEGYQDKIGIYQDQFAYRNLNQSTDPYTEVFWSKGIGI